MKEAIAKKEEKLEALLLQAESSPAIIAVRAQQAAAILTTRTDATRKIAALRNEESLTIPKLEAVRAAKEKIYLAAKIALQAASDEFQTAHAALSIERSQFTNEIIRQEQVLFESADPALDAAILFFRDKLDYLRSPGRISRNAIGSENNLISWRKKTFEENNTQAVHDALRYCMDAITALEIMKLTPEVDKVKIEGLKDGIPSIDQYAVFTGSAPMPKALPSWDKLHNFVDERIEALKIKAGIA